MVTATEATDRVARTAVAVAFEPPPPEMLTEGAEEYPEPPLVTVRLASDVGVRLAVAAAPEPPPPKKATEGAEV